MTTLDGLEMKCNETTFLKTNESSDTDWHKKDKKSLVKSQTISNEQKK